MITLAYLVTLGLCWSESKLAAAAKLWPSESVTWTWFLGERLGEMTRAEAALRVQVAFAHYTRTRMKLPAMPVKPGVAVQWFKHCSDEQFDAAARALGAWLDDPTESTHAALAAALAEKPPEVIEASP